MQIAETGLKSGIGAKMMRPAAAIAPSVAVGIICLSGGFDFSYPKKYKSTPAMATAKVKKAEFSC